MAKFKAETVSLPTDYEAIESGYIRRPIKGGYEKFQDSMTSPDVVMAVMLVCAFMMILLPWSFVFAAPLGAIYYIWASSRRYRLPFKTPMNWGGVDYGSPKPGQPGKYAKAEGILYFGRDEQSLEELWIENGDARRHGFFIGTTGSGKALPMDALVLTPKGWIKNEDIYPGLEICHPDGGTSKVTSIHRQGVIPTVRLIFADGRSADCSLDHLWHIRAKGLGAEDAPISIPEEGRIMEASDLGILHGLYKDKMEICTPYPVPHQGPQPENNELSEDHAIRAAEQGFKALDYMPSVIGSPGARRDFLNAYLRYASKTSIVTDYGIRVCGFTHEDAVRVKQMIFSLGGTALTFYRARDVYDVQFMVDAIEEFHPDAVHCKWPNELGLEIIDIQRLDRDQEMSCIKVDRPDGLYVMENHIVTHNTELLLGVVSQTLMWSSGFLFIDGKGTTEFYARAWTLCKRFGREDDLRVLNFTDPGDDPDAPAGGPSTQSNTLNPFAKGSPDQLMNIVVSLMGDAGSGNDMWKSRAVSLVTSLMMGLCELRDNGEILLNVQTIRDFLFLGKGFDKDKLGAKKIKSIEEVPEAAWEDLRGRAGLIELYMRALNGELSNATKLAMKGFFDTLPGFSIDKALNGDAQEGKANEQYNFLSMQLTKPLGSLADGYGHIFRTPLGEIDMDDVVLNRRILVVLLPALQKAPDEMQNCGKIVVTMAKIMMGNASGFALQGSRQEIVEAKQTRAPSPYIVVLDEAGYYMVKGIDTMMAQARSLGFMIIVAGQDMAAMQAIDPQIAETAAANASILAVGKTVDGNKTVQFVQQLMGKVTVSVTSGYHARSTALGGTKWDDRMDASFQEIDKVKTSDLQNLSEGQFYFLFNGKLVRAATFYIGNDFAENFSVNKFIKVRGPTDKVPNLDQSVDESFIDGYVKFTDKLIKGLNMKSVAPEPADSLSQIKRIAMQTLNGTASRDSEAYQVSWLAGLLGVLGDGEGSAKAKTMDDHDEDIEDTWGAEPDTPPVIDKKTPPTVNRQRPHITAEDDAPPPRQSRLADTMRKSPIRASALKKAPADIPRKLSEGLNRVTEAQDVRSRHGPLVGLISQEAAAIEEAQRSGALGDLQDEPPRVTQETFGSMFSAMAENMNRMERLLISELADGNLGAEIMQRAVSINPVPMPMTGKDAEEYIKSRLESLEEHFT